MSLAATPKDWTFASLTYGQVDRARGVWDERNRRWPVAFAEDPKRAVTALESEIFDIARTRLAYPEPVPTQQDCEIERGADRPAQALIEDFDQSVARLALVWRQMTPDTWDRSARRCAADTGDDLGEMD